VFCLLEIAEPPQAQPITVQTAKPRAIIDPSPKQNAIAKSVKWQLAYQDAHRSAKYRDPGSAPGVEALTLAQIKSAGYPKGRSRSLRERRVPVGRWANAILREIKNIFQNSHQNSHSRAKKKTAFGGGL
jgi:hypothetical protein